MTDIPEWCPRCWRRLQSYDVRGGMQHLRLVDAVIQCGWCGYEVARLSQLNGDPATARAEAARYLQQYEALRAAVGGVAQSLLWRARTATDYWNRSGHPYYDGQADAFGEAEQMVRRVLDEEGGGPDAH